MTENEGGIEILVVLSHVLSVILHRLLFVHGVEVELGVLAFNGLEIHTQGFLDTAGAPGKHSGQCLVQHVNTIKDRCWLVPHSARRSSQYLVWGCPQDWEEEGGKSEEANPCLCVDAWE